MDIRAFVLLLLLPGTIGLGTVVVPGDVYIELIDAIYIDEACTVVETESAQNMMAIKWALKEYINKDFIDGVNIGKFECSSRLLKA